MEPITELEQRFASELAAVIARRRLSQREAATLIGCSPKHLNMVLRLKSRASLPAIAKWSERLGITWEVNATTTTTRTEALRDRAGGPLSK